MVFFFAANELVVQAGGHCYYVKNLVDTQRFPSWEIAAPDDLLAVVLDTLPTYALSFFLCAVCLCEFCLD